MPTHPSPPAAPQSHPPLPAQGEPIRVKRAPEPSDVIWENLQYSKREQALRQTASTLTMCVIASAGIFGIFASNFFIAPGVNPTVSISSTIQYLGQVRPNYT
jgi:hypothetical protein